MTDPTDTQNAEQERAERIRRLQERRAASGKPRVAPSRAAVSHEVVTPQAPTGARPRTRRRHPAAGTRVLLAGLSVASFFTVGGSDAAREQQSERRRTTGVADREPDRHGHGRIGNGDQCDGDRCDGDRQVGDLRHARGAHRHTRQLRALLVDSPGAVADVVVHRACGWDRVVGAGHARGDRRPATLDPPRAPAGPGMGARRPPLRRRARRRLPRCSPRWPRGRHVHRVRPRRPLRPLRELVPSGCGRARHRLDVPAARDRDHVAPDEAHVAARSGTASISRATCCSRWPRCTGSPPVPIATTRSSGCRVSSAPPSCSS